MVRYIKCPRCELNYIDADKQEYCDVCIAEMKGNKLQFADLEDDELEEALEAENTEICPICGVNRMAVGETMCESCRRKTEYEEADLDPEKDEEWKNYLDEDMEDLTLDDEELEEEFAEDEEEEEEESEPDDFDDDLSDLADDDFDDDDEDDDFDDDDDDLF